MLGLIIIAVFGFYLLVSLLVVKFARNWAKRTGRSPSRWGWTAALGMYLLVFWNWIPTVLLHKYYCATQAGFTVYETLDHWKKQNSDVMETLSNSKKPPSQNLDNNVMRGWINQRIYVETKQELVNPYIGRTDEVLVDATTKDVLAKATDFWRGNANPFELGADSIREFKFWLYKRGCYDEGMNPAERFYGLQKEAFLLGEGK